MDTTEPAGRSLSGRHPLINRNYTLLWTGRTISITGDYVFTVGLMIWIALVLGRGHAWAPLAVSGALLASTLPVVVAGPLAGVFVDRWNKRRTMLWSDALRAGLLAVLVVILSGGAVGALPAGPLLAVVYGTLILVNGCDQFFRLSMVSLIPSIVPEREQPRALGMGQAAAALAMIVGPPIAAPLVLTFGIRWALIVNALTFLISYATVWAIDPPPAPAPSSRAADFGRELRAGWHFVLGSRVLVTMMLASVTAMLGGAAINTLDVFFVTHNLHTPGSWYGLLDGVFGVGAVAGAVLAAAFAERLGLKRVLWSSLLLLGLLVMVYARLTSFAPAAVLLFCCGIPMAALQVGFGSLMIRVTPQHLVGRVSAIMDPLAVLAMLVGTVGSGYLDSVVLRGFHAHLFGAIFGPVDTIFTAAGALVLAGGIAAMAGFNARSGADETAESNAA